MSPLARRQMVVKLLPEVHDRLRAAAEEREVPANWLAGRLISEGLERLTPADEWLTGPDRPTLDDL